MAYLLLPTRINSSLSHSYISPSKQQPASPEHLLKPSNLFQDIRYGMICCKDRLFPLQLGAISIVSRHHMKNRFYLFVKGCASHIMIKRYEGGKDRPFVFTF